jgi:hypothetical protein
MGFSGIKAAVIGMLVAGLLAGQNAGITQTPANPAQIANNGSAVVRGTVKDATGAIIPGATVTLTDSDNATRTVTSGGDGSYAFRGVPAGIYSVSTTFAGMQQKTPLAVSVSDAQSATANVVMSVQTQKQEVTVTDSTTNVISTEAANNASALVLKPEDLDALPDDPDDLQADLSALAGPSAGPGGNQVYIDGFTGGRLPPKASIREIRINSNPFSAEFDKLGYGRIQIFTKPGSDKFHGQGYYTISDDVWNSRNPFLSVNPPFRTQLFGGNVSGPLGKNASFFIDVERRNIDDNGIINATIPDPTFTSSSRYQNYYSTPQRRTTVSPRLDYQLGANNTLSFRYGYLANDHIVSGITAFNLPALNVGNIDYPSTGYSSSSPEHTFQVVETAVLSPKAVNEVHFQFDRTSMNSVSQSTAPSLSVAQSFTAGGSGYSAVTPAGTFPASTDVQNGYELRDYASLTLGAHSMKFGIRIRATDLYDSSPKGFNGSYIFNGGSFPALDSNLNPIAGQMVNLLSIDQYLLTEQLFAKGLSSQQITGMGYGPSKYTVTAGNPSISFYQLDFGPFIQDDWKVRPNLTVNFGLRWESQTNINDKNDWAPRVGFAWSPDAKGGNGRSKTVIRGGWGYFYDRFAITNVETAYRYNQSANAQTSYTENFLQGNCGVPMGSQTPCPAYYDAGFDTYINPSLLTAEASQRYQIDSSLKAPRLMQTALSIERQLFSHTTLNANYVYSRGTHELRTVDINAPVPTAGNLPPGSQNSTAPIIRPYGNGIGDIYNFESDGTFKQNQIMVGVNSQIGRWLTLFSRYSYANAHSDTDGLATLPSNPYNFAQDWGRSILNVQHNLFFGGSMTTKWGLRFSPFLVAHTGTPYNITTGPDLFLQGNGTPTARPGLASGPGPGIVESPYGYLIADPLVAPVGTSNVIARNAAFGPGFVGLNLRVSKTWGFGTTKFSGASGGSHARGGGGGGGGGRGGRGGGGFSGGRGMGGSGESTEHRYNLTLSVNARNILNHENLNTPNGAMTSGYFLQSTGITGGYGAESTASNQRRLDLQLRFSF